MKKKLVLHFTPYFHSIWGVLGLTHHYCMAVQGGDQNLLVLWCCENAHEGVPAVTGTIKDWCESLIFYQ